MTLVSKEIRYVMPDGRLTLEGLALLQDIIAQAGTGGGGGATDLGYTASTRLLTSSTGADVTLPLVGVNPGLMSAADKTKLDGLGNGGTATLNFGAAPGASTASVVVTGQTGITTGSRIRAWVQGSTVDFNEYEHSRVLPLVLALGISDVVAGTGFTIQAATEHRLDGLVSVRWEWA